LSLLQSEGYCRSAARASGSQLYTVTRASGSQSRELQIQTQREHPTATWGASCFASRAEPARVASSTGRSAMRQLTPGVVMTTGGSPSLWRRWPMMTVTVLVNGSACSSQTCSSKAPAPSCAPMHRSLRPRAPLGASAMSTKPKPRPTLPQQEGSRRRHQRAASGPR